MTAIVQTVKQDTPIRIEISGQDKILMLHALQRALPSPKDLPYTNPDYVKFISGLEQAFRYELNKKD